MNNERIVSMQAKSNIYHKPMCKYVSRMKKQNKMSMPRIDAKKAGLHVCRYCNGMTYHMNNEKEALEFYNKAKHLEYKYIDNILYVKSELGCWKLIYIRKEEKIALYHRNATNKPLDFEHPQFEQYHCQGDKQYSYYIESILNYIYEHDKYKATIARGEEVTSFSSEKYRRNEARAKRKRDINRVNSLFRLIEKQNSGYKELSFC